MESVELQKIRKKNLEWLISKNFSGIVKDFTEKIGKQTSFVYGLLASTEKDTSRSITGKMARHIEEKCEIPQFSLDLENNFNQIINKSFMTEKSRQNLDVYNYTIHESLVIKQNEFEQIENRWLTIPDNFIPNLEKVMLYESCFFKAPNDYMSPFIEKDNLVLLEVYPDGDAVTLVHTGIYLIRLHEQEYFVRMFLNIDKTITVKIDNQSKLNLFPEFTVSEDDIHKILFVWGRAIFSIKSFI